MSAYKNLFDTHLHTEWSGDSSTPVLDQINRAKELGLSGITITDHMDLDFPETPDRFKLDLPNYLSTLKKIALQESSPDFEILIGMELGPSVLMTITLFYATIILITLLDHFISLMVWTLITIPSMKGSLSPGATRLTLPASSQI